MGISVHLPEMNIKEEEVKLLLAIKLLIDLNLGQGEAEVITLANQSGLKEMSRFRT